MSERARVSYDGNMTFTLTIRGVNKEDRGEFLCLANNNLVPERNISKAAVLKVNCKSLNRVKKFVHLNFFPVQPEIRNFPRFSKFAQNLMHQIELKCVAYGYPDVKIFWRKAGAKLDPETYLFDNQGRTKKVRLV